MADTTDQVDKRVNQAGGVALGFGVKEAVTLATANPALGIAAGAASAFAPDRAKTGAAVGAVAGASAAGHVMILGTAAGAAAGVALFLPLVLGGAVVCGGLAWIFGNKKK